MYTLSSNSNPNLLHTFNTCSYENFDPAPPPRILTNSPFFCLILLSISNLISSLICSSVFPFLRCRTVYALISKYLVSLSCGQYLHLNILFLNPLYFNSSLRLQSSCVNMKLLYNVFLSSLFNSQFTPDTIIPKVNA